VIPDFWRKLTDVVGLYLHPRIRLWYSWLVDEKSQIKALDPQPNRGCRMNKVDCGTG